MTDTNNPDPAGKAPSGPQDGPESQSGGPDTPQDQNPGKSASGDSGNAPDSDASTFPANYVKELRGDVAKYRVRAKKSNERLVTSMAAATGRLADATDLPFADDLLDDDGMPDEEKVIAAIDDLLKRKPHLASRKPSGDVGQGMQDPKAKEFSLAGLLRQGAGS